MNKELEALTTITLYGDEIDGEKINITYQEYLKAHTIIEEALKRNEPMKVIYGTLSNGLSGVICPKCKCCRVSRKVNVNIKFCEQCGQKLDWSDEK